MARRKSRTLNRHYPGFLESLGLSLANNFTLILAIAFLFGIAHTLDRVGGMIRHAGEAQALDGAQESQEEATANNGDEPASKAGISEESWERIKHHERCTHSEYREKYFLACFPDGTRVYDRPDMDSGTGNTA